jgi:hypothetical protein
VKLNLEVVAYPAVLLVAVTSTGILISQTWRWVIALLIIQYAGIFVLAGLSWPFQMVLTKLIAGWMAAVVLWIALRGSETQGMIEGDQITQPAGPPPQAQLSGKLFRIFAASLVGLVIVSSPSLIVQWLPTLANGQILGSVILIGIGLLHLGLTSEPYRVVVGLLTVMAGFEIMYAGIEVSALVQGLLAAVNLGLGLIGAYLLLSPAMESVE